MEAKRRTNRNGKTGKRNRRRFKNKGKFRRR